MAARLKVSRSFTIKSKQDKEPTIDTAKEILHAWEHRGRAFFDNNLDNSSSDGVMKHPQPRRRLTRSSNKSLCIHPSLNNWAKGACVTTKRRVHQMTYKPVDRITIEEVKTLRFGVCVIIDEGRHVTLIDEDYPLAAGRKTNS